MRSLQEAKDLLARLYCFKFPDSLFLVHEFLTSLGAMKEAREVKRLVGEAVAASAKGRALPALSLGRSLWYYGVASWLVNSADYAGER